MLCEAFCTELNDTFPAFITKYLNNGLFLFVQDGITELPTRVVTKTNQKISADLERFRQKCQIFCRRFANAALVAMYLRLT